MAISTQAPRSTPGPPPGETSSYRSGRDRPVGGFELWSWLFMRISGIVLLVLAVGHTLIMHVVGEGVDRLRVIILDYVRPPGVRFALNMFFSTLGFLLFVLGTVIVFTFDPSTWPAGSV